MSSIEMCQASKSHSTFDFEGLEESLVDNNEDDDDDDFNDLSGLTDPAMLPDMNGPALNYDHNLFLIRDALIRDSANRTEEDIEIIVRFLSIINSNHDHMTRRRLAPHFVLAEIEARDTRVLTHGEKLDAYCIVAAGSLRHVLPVEENLLMQDVLGSSVDGEGDSLQSHNQLNNNCTTSRHVHPQNVGYLHVGDEFGAHLDDRIVYGEIFTNEDFVWVLCVPHVIFDQICGEKTFKTIRDEVTGNIIEMRANCQLPALVSSNDVPLSSTTNQAISTQLASNLECSAVTQDDQSASGVKGAAKPAQPDSNELIRATKERLYELLLNSEPNETFVEDFLLTFRIWAEKDLHSSKDSQIMADLMERICNNIRNGIHVENCVRILLLWMDNHFQDFQNSNRYLLDEFENVLKENPLYKTQLRLFHMNLSAKSVQRLVTITRSDRNSSLPFSLIGGYECTARLFIGEIILAHLNQHNSPQSLTSSPVVDLRPGDRVISINGIDCHVMPIGRAYELCRSSTHLSLKVKYDPHLFYALIEGRHENKRQIVESFPLASRAQSATLPGSISSSSLSSRESKKGTSTSSMLKQKMRSLVSTTNQLMNSTSNIRHNNANGQNMNNGSSTMNASFSSSSISSLSGSSNASNSISASNPASHSRIVSYEVAEIIKIYLFENNECRFLPIHSSTTARECIQLALREFQLQSNYSSRDFALYEYSVIMSNGLPDENTMASSTVVKRLSDGTSDLVRNLGLNSRLYLKMVSPPKDSSSGGHHLSDSDIAKEILKDSSLNSLHTLECSAIARELTARDFRLFCRIESQQFVYDLAYNGPNESNSSNQSLIFERAKELQEFERKTNEEMFWTINQVLGEKRSLAKRVKAIKQLIRVATLSMKLNNYNTLFAILSGLMHLSVSRLKSCWDRVPTKHMKQLQKLQQLMDPSRNFYNFRQQLMQKLRGDNAATIIIPFFPLVKKDLSFIWLANQTYVKPAESSETKPSKSEMLVNWEKMRLLSEKIREIEKMANTTSLAMAAMNGMHNGNGNVNNQTNSALVNDPIDPSILFRIFADSITNEDPRTFSHKKLWENQRMVKRVQCFLDDTFGSVTSDEHLLMSRSYSCELPHTPNASHATTRSSIASTMSSSSQLSHPSPTPSSASSSSNSLSMHSDGTSGQFVHRPHRPKFGQSSPNQLKKLLALSDGAVIVPHNNSSQSSSSSSNNNNNNNNNNNHHNNNNVGNHSTGHGSNSSSTQWNTGHAHHTMNHHPSVYSQHNTHRSSNSSLNSSLSGSTSYYNSLNGHTHHSSQYHTLNGYGSNTSYAGASKTYSSHTSHHQSFMAPSPSSQSAPAPPCCCTSQSAGPLFPNQSYCSCFSRSMRTMLMIPQTSGLMHPSCPSCQPGSQPSSRRYSSSIPFKQPLPVESSSVTSMRKLEEYQQMTRYREQARFSSKQSSSSSSSRRPQCPDYDTAIQRLCNASLMNGGPLPSSSSSKSGSLYSHRSRSSSRQHHREDVV